MSNTLLNISMITRESLRILKNELGFAKGVNRQYDDQFAQNGAKIGSVINIRKPVRFTVTDGAALNIQDVTDQSVPLTLSNQKHVAFQFTSKDLALSIDEFSKRYIQPAVVALANKIDYDGLGLYSSVWNSVGVPGTTPNTALLMLQAMQKLDENAAPMDGERSICLNPAAQASMVDALKGLFQSSEKIKEQYEKGRMGEAFGATFKMDQNVQSFTTGDNYGDTILVNDTGAADGDTDLVLDGCEASAVVFNVGDVFTIAGVYAVNPQSRQSTGSLMQFVVTQTTTADGSGNATVTYSPALQSTGQYQNISALPADDAAITPVQSASTDGVVTPQNMAYHRDAFVLGMADLPLPGGVDKAARASDPDAGLSVRIVRAYDINNDVFPCRLDILYGWAAVYPELACRIFG